MVKVAVAQMAAAETMEENYEKSLRFMKEASEGAPGFLFFPKDSFPTIFPSMKIGMFGTFPCLLIIPIYGDCGEPAENSASRRASESALRKTAACMRRI